MRIFNWISEKYYDFREKFYCPHGWHKLEKELHTHWSMEYGYPDYSVYITCKFCGEIQFSL